MIYYHASTTSPISAIEFAANIERIEREEARQNDCMERGSAEGQKKDLGGGNGERERCHPECGKIPVGEKDEGRSADRGRRGADEQASIDVSQAVGVPGKQAKSAGQAGDTLVGGWKEQNVTLH